MENVPEITPVKAGVENAHSREKVEGALKNALGRYKKASDEKRLDDKPELTWKFQEIENAYKETLEKSPPSTTYENEFDNHPSDPPAHYNQQEGIPVDGLIEFIKQELDALPPDAAERKELKEQLKILEDESVSYVAVSADRTRPGQLVARVTKEAHFIAHDPIIHAAIVDKLRVGLGREPTQQEIDEANWFEGINALTARRELVIPDDTHPRSAPVAETGNTPIHPAPAPLPPNAAPPATGGTPPVDSIDNLRLEARIIDHTQSTAQRAQKESQQSVDNRMREGKWWQFWRWPQKTWIRWTQPYQVESGRQRLMEAMARNGTSYVTMETATRAVGQLGTERAKEQEDKQNILRRFTSGAVTDQANARGEKIVEVTNQALRQQMVAEVLRPIVDSMRNGAPLTEDQVQNSLRTFVRNNLRTHPELQEFFGPNANDFGELASSFATDLIEMGRRTNEAMTRYNKTLEELDQYIHIRVANARGFDTDQRGAIAKWIASARRRESYMEAGIAEHAGGRIGVLLNPFVVGVGASLALQAMTMATRKEAVVAGGVLSGGASLLISAAAGGIVAGIRRNRETLADYRRHLFERESGEGVVGPRGRGLGAAVNFLSGGSTREQLERVRSNLKIASAKQILEGGATDVATGEPQQMSVADLLTSNDVVHIARRIAEIQSRQKNGADNRVALISYADPQKEIADLEIARYQLQQRLEAITTGPAAAQDEIDREKILYDRVFMGDKTDKTKEGSIKITRRALTKYILGNSLKASGFGLATGALGGVASHEALNLIAHAAPQAADIPVIGGLFGKHQVTEVAPAAVNTGINRDILKQLYENPGNLKLPNGMELAVDGQTHHATIIDVDGQTLNLPPINLTENGSIVVAGNPDLIPEDVKKIIDGWEIKSNEAPAYNFHNKLEQVIQSGQHEGFAHGNLEIDMNSADGGQMSMRVLRELGNPDSGIQVHGFARMENGQPVLDFDQSFNGNANYSADDWKLLHDELGKDGWAITPEEVPGKTIIETGQRPVAWEKHEALLDHREWYDNNTRPSDLNELRMNTVKNGNAMEIRMDRMNADGSFSDMLDPRNLNVPEVVKNGRAGVAFSFPGEESKRALIAQVNTPRGLSLDPTDTDPNSVIHLWNDKTQVYDLTMQRGEFSKMVINHNAYQNLPDGYVETELNKRYDVWRVGQDDKFGTISTGVPKVVNGNTVWQSAATIRGTQAPQPTTIPPHFIYHVAPPPAIEIIAPPAPPPAYAFDSMYIPTDFVPRRPLPPLEKTIPPVAPPPPPPPGIPEYFGYPPEYGFGYGYGGGGTERGAVGTQRYIDWLKRVGYYPIEAPYVKGANGKLYNQNGSAIVRNVDRERDAIRQYLARQAPEQKKMTEGYARTIQPMENECRVAVNIPAYNEGKNIYHTLTEWSNQQDKNGNLIDRKKYEINIIINGPKGYTKDNTAEEIERFKRANPDVRVNVISIEIPDPKGNVGQARKIISDITLQRSINRPTQAGSLYIESEDADLMEIDRRAVDRLITKFDERPEIDALRGKQDLTPTILMENDYLFFDRRVDRLAEYLLRDYRLRPDRNENFDFYWNRYITGGWNTAYTAESYALIGGYMPAHVGEDVDIGRRISVLRGSKNAAGEFIPNVDVISNVPNTGHSNPRRFILALIKKIPAYHDFTNEDFNREMRNRTLPDMMADIDFGKRIDATNVQNFEDIISRARIFLGWKISDPALQEKTFTRLMFSLGFKKYRDVPQADGSVIREVGSLNEKGPDWKSDYHITPDGKVKIDNIENIKNAFEEYRRQPRGQRKP